MAENTTNTSIIVITGPESTGKTQLSLFLSQETGMPWVPELSRSYVEGLNRPYTFADVESIARSQIQQFQHITSQGHSMVIFDTDLIITKVWFDVVYRQCPAWVVEAIRNQPVTLHLLCNTDIPWIPDGVRENGGEMREKLFSIYQKELQDFNIPYKIISGKGAEREQNALKILRNDGLA